MSPEAPPQAPGGERTLPRLRASGDAATMMRDVGLALVPCFVIGTWAVGRQAVLALSAARLEQPPGWRGRLLSALGAEADPQRALACLLQGAVWVLPLLALACATTLGWELAVARLRHRPPGHGALVTALVFTALLPPATPPGQAVLGASFGMVFGKLVFGGTGRNPFNPAATGLAMLWLSWPQEMLSHPLFPDLAGYRGSLAFAQAAEGGVTALSNAGLSVPAAFFGAVPGRIGETSTLACLLAAVWLLHRRLVSGRVIAGVLLGAALAAGVARAALGGETGGAALTWPWHLVLGGLAFAAVFVATDPVSSASTQAGRLLYGLLIGGLVVLLRIAGPGHPDGVVPAVLLGNVSAPLIDHAVVQLGLRRRLRRRRRAHG